MTHTPAGLEIPKNPLLGGPASDPTVDASTLETPFSTAGHVPDQREIRKVLRTETAREALGTIYSGCAIFGITKGQFSLIELIDAALDQTGPAAVTVSTWTAANADIREAFALLESGKITDARFIVDFTFQRRQPAFAKALRDLFGSEALRVTRNHSKFVLIRNADWSLVIKSSMNLNMNPRLENFDIQDDARLADFLETLVAEIWRKGSSTDGDDAPSVNKARFKSL